MFKSLFKKKNLVKKEDSKQEEKIFTLACLLIEAALADETFGEDEKIIIIKILKNYYKNDNTKFLKEIAFPHDVFFAL